MDRKDVFEYVKKQYGTVPEYLWKESPESAVLRHKNGKWYAVLMQVKKSKLELEGEELFSFSEFSFHYSNISKNHYFFKVWR